MSKQDLLDAVSLDNKTIERYIIKYGDSSAHAGIKTILDPWAKNNKTLFALLGSKLMHKFKVNLKRTEPSILADLADLYTFFRDTGVVNASSSQQKSAFVNEYINYIEALELPFDMSYAMVHKPLNAVTMYRDSITFDSPKIVIEHKGEKLILQNGMKPIRTIGKIVRFLGAENFPNYEEFRQKHSSIMTGTRVKGEITLSIHPLDFITMSDNDNDWHSCMSWAGQEGCYRRGTLEMMNSNNILIAYMESSSPYRFDLGYKWNNKSWRTLVCVDKDIIVSGKAYPYINDELSKAIVQEIRNLAKENLNWTYRYGVQEYKDMYGIWNTEQFYVHPYYLKKRIVFSTRFMYNDMMKDSNTDYWCVRNKVKQQKIISLAGKAYCLDCGKELQYHEDRDGEETLTCDNCYIENSCTDCGHYLHDYEAVMIHEKKYCRRCADKLRVCPDCGTLVRYGRNFLVPHNEETLTKLKSDTPELYGRYWRDIKDKTDATEVKVCDSCYNKMRNEGAFKFLSSGYLYNPYLLVPHSEDSDYVQNHIWDNWVSALELEGLEYYPVQPRGRWNEVIDRIMQRDRNVSVPTNLSDLVV